MPHPEVPDGAEPPRPGEGGDERATFRRSDFRLMRRAARANWGVPDELKGEALFQAARILADPAAKPREKLAASAFLVMADRADQSATRLPAPRPEAERLKRIAIPDAPVDPPGPAPIDPG